MARLRRLAARLIPTWVIYIGIRFRARSRVPILLYHAIGPHSREREIRNSLLHRVSVDDFTEQVERLRTHYQIVFVDEIFNRLRRGKTVSGLASITFDDGYKSVVDMALPVLEREQIPATIFLSTGLGNGEIFWRDKIRGIIERGHAGQFTKFAHENYESLRALNADRLYKTSKDPAVSNSRDVHAAINEFVSGEMPDLDPARYSPDSYVGRADIASFNPELVMIGNHTVNHYVLSSLTRQEQQDEIEGARAYIKTTGMDESAVFSIPFGGRGDYNDETLELVRDAGYSGYLLSQHRISHTTELTNQASQPHLIIGADRVMPRASFRQFCWQLTR